MIGQSSASRSDGLVRGAQRRRSDLVFVVWDIERARSISAAATCSSVPRFPSSRHRPHATRRADERRRRATRDRALPHLRSTASSRTSPPRTILTVERRAPLERFASPQRSRTGPRLCPAAASAGVASFALRGITGARLAVYGLHAAPHLASALPLRPALSWRSRVHRIASVPAGAGVSYGHEYRLPRDGRIATVPVGYGDGLPRIAGKRGTVLLRGRRVPFAGRICMDLVMLDVTDIDGARELTRSWHRREGGSRADRGGLPKLRTIIEV